MVALTRSRSLRAAKFVWLACVAGVPAAARAQPGDPAPTAQVPAPASDPASSGEPAPAPAAAPSPVGSSLSLPRIQIHGFVSGGAFVSTANDYIGHSSRGSLEFFEGGINFSTNVTDKLRVGIQLFSQDQGASNDPTPRLDWAFLDYRWRRWLGARVGRVKIPFGLYNDYVDIDAGRTTILLPQSLYPVNNRSILTAHTGFSAYGNASLASAGELDYQVYAGALSAPIASGQDANGNRVYALDSKYVIGGAVFWHPPVEGLRVGGSLLRASIDQYLNLAPSLTEALILLGIAPADFDGNIIFSLDPASLWVASAEYIRGDWLFATEYSRWFARTPFTPPIVPPDTTLSERFYVMMTYRLSRQIDSSVYYSLIHANIHDRGGTNQADYPEPFHAWQRDAAATVRYDVNDNWLWKLEAHFIDGTGDPNATFLNEMPKRYWGLFFARTTVTF